jgi:hypothetical protein
MAYFESYYELSKEQPPRCLVQGCSNPPVVEIHTDDYARLLNVAWNRTREKQKRRAGDPRFYVCETHIEDPQFRTLQWQGSMFLEV